MFVILNLNNKYLFIKENYTLCLFQDKTFLNVLHELQSTITNESIVSDEELQKQQEVQSSSVKSLPDEIDNVNLSLKGWLVQQGSNMHKGTFLHRDTFASSFTFAQRDIFAQRHFCTKSYFNMKGHFCTRVKKNLE